ncbi:MAG: ABC transporter permease, partial [candidate division Zixibacteria bacterium]|nr:ABC transporter permease [candidate division Zixibacteria bacterium]
MLKNYLIVAFRSLRRTTTTSIINILGLAVGMAASLLILHYVTFETSYDNFHRDSDRIYRLRYERTDNTGLSVKFASCCPPAAARIRDKYPEVEKIGRMLNTRGSISRGETVFLEERIFYAEPDVFNVLKFEFTEGDPLTGLAQPGNAFLSQTTARKYFGDENPVGQTISFDRRVDYKVAGVFRDIPANSHLKFDILLPWENLAAAAGPDYTEAWGHTGSYTYLRTAPGVDPLAFEGKLQELVQAECTWLKEYDMAIDLKMQPLSDIHLTSHFMQEYEANGDRQSVDYLLIIAVFIMIMAWVNFVNLSTAGATSRAKEVGLRKVVGASRRQLAAQFFSELAITNLLSGLCAAALLVVSLPYFNHLIGLPSGYYPWLQEWFWLTFGGMLLVGVFLSGLYPVLVLSSFEPIAVMKGFLARAAHGFNLRKVLVVIQFAVAAGLIIATITVFRQMSFMRNQDLGFAIDQTLVVRMPRVRTAATYGSSFESLKETLLQQGGIAKVCHVTEVPGRQIYWDNGGIYRVGQDQTEGKNYQIIGVDHDFADVLELQFVAGRNFSRDFPADEKALVLSETAVRQMGFKDAASAIGEQVNYWDEIFPIIGVVKDHHQQSLKVAYEPHIFRFMPYGRGSMGMITIKLRDGNISETVDKVRQRYNEFFPGNSFDYFFLDDYYNQQYAADVLFGRVYGLFTLLAIIIIVLGVYGLSSYSVTRLTKEIGIRKVLGATIPAIVGLGKAAELARINMLARMKHLTLLRDRLLTEL